MFLIVFSTVLLILNIYCFTRKKYLYLFIPCMLLLPNYYGFQIYWLPVLSVTRIMFLVFYFYSYINRRRDFDLRNFSFKKFPRYYSLLALYFALRIISNLYYVTTYIQAIKTILLIIFEQLLLLIAIYYLMPRSEEQFTLIKAIVWSATAVSLCAIAESFTSYRIFDNLYTVSKAMLNERYVRLGLLRSTATFGLPTLFGNACLLVFPLVLYLYEKTRYKRYLLCSLVFVFAVIHSGCRSDMLFLIFTTGIYALQYIKDIQRLKLLTKNIITIIIISGIIIGILSSVSPKYAYFYSGTGKSVLNSVGFDLPIEEETAPEGVEGYGEILMEQNPELCCYPD